MTEDLERLDEEIKKNPDEPLWAVLARLGWVPPTTADSFRRRIHELEGEHAVAADLKIGQLIETGAEIVAITKHEEFVFVILSDGSRHRFSRLDSVRVSRPSST